MLRTTPPKTLSCHCSHSYCRAGKCKTEGECYYVARISHEGRISNEAFGCADKTLPCSDFLNYTISPSLKQVPFQHDRLIRRCCSRKNCVLELRDE
uniref:Uncharacterized protein n=1 Tax=Romanomermis culicivorax TaxID=13658 RepID=A0A915KYR5_ROMCU